MIIINSAVMNIGVYVFLSFPVSLVCIPISGIAGSYGSSICSFFFFFKGISTLFSIVALLVCIPTNSVRGFPFLHTFSTAFIACRLLDSSHSDLREMVPHCGFDLHFSDNE